MKKKYVFVPNLIFDHNECTEYLEFMSKKGWKLKTITPHFAIFIPCQHSYKYQIDYTELNEEFNDIVNKEGYEHIACYFNIHIYANKNLHALDLQTDEDIHQLFLNKYYSKSSMLGITFLGLLFIIFGMVGCYHFVNEPIALIYIETRLLCLSIGSLLLGSISIYSGFVIHLKRKSIEQTKYSYQHFRPYDNTQYIMLILLVIACMILCFICQMNPLGFIFLFILAGVYNYTNYSLIPKLETKTKRNIMIVFIVIIWFIGQFLIRYTFQIYDNMKANVPDYFPAYEEVYASQENLFIYEVNAVTPNTHILHSQNYYRCLNENIAKDIFKYTVIEGEKLARLTSRENIDQSSYQTDEWSIEDIQPRPYDEAMSLYHFYPSKYFEECYYLDNVVIARHKNIVVQLVVNHINDIDKTLKEYIEFR